MKSGSYEQFSHILSQLKQEGTLVLVLANGDTESVRILSSQLFGIDRNPIVFNYYNIVSVEDRRSSSQAVGDIVTLESAEEPAGDIKRAVAGFCRSKDSKRGDFRPCLDSLSGLHADRTDAETESVVRVLREETIDRRGIGHVITADTLDAYSDAVLSCFDILIHTRVENDERYQRWTLPEYDQKTSWVSLQESTDRP